MTDIDDKTPDLPAKWDPEGESTRYRRTWIYVFLVGALISGLGFGYKLFEFFGALNAVEGFEFAGVHLIVYGLVASGFLLLLVNGVLGGHFGSIEEPKLELLEREERYDRETYGY